MRDHRNDEKRSWWWKVGGVVFFGGLALAAAAGIYRMDPEQELTEATLLGCGFKQVTGLDCPGCGATRATHYLLHGDVVAAFQHNPAYVGGVPLLLGAVPVWLAAVRRGVRLSTATVWGIWLTLLILLLVYWVVRNLAWWPWPLS